MLKQRTYCALMPIVFLYNKFLWTKAESFDIQFNKLLLLTPLTLEYLFLFRP